MSIVDDQDVDVGFGKVGKLRYKGPGVADSFYNDPQSSAEHFKNGWFYPGIWLNCMRMVISFYVVDLKK